MTINDQEDVRLLKIIPTREIWEAAQKLLAKKLGQPAFEMWIRPTQLTDYQGGQAIIAVSNEFACNMITNKYADSIATVIGEVTQEKVTVKVVVDPSALPEAYTATIASITGDPTKNPSATTGTGSGSDYSDLAGLNHSDLAGAPLTSA